MKLTWRISIFGAFASTSNKLVCNGARQASLQHRQWMVSPLVLFFGTCTHHVKNPSTSFSPCYVSHMLRLFASESFQRLVHWCILVQSRNPWNSSCRFRANISTSQSGPMMYLMLWFSFKVLLLLKMIGCNIIYLHIRWGSKSNNFGRFDLHSKHSVLLLTFLHHLEPHNTTKCPL